MTEEVPMLYRCSGTVLAMTLVFFPETASTQGRPSAADQDRELAQIIRQAGYDCSLISSIVAPPDPPPGWEGLRPEIALCVNGKRYLVTKSARGGGNALPVVRPMD